MCVHKGCLASWNIDRLKINPNKPDISIETSACITSLAAHPEYPAIVAVGLFNGEIFVYDIRQDDPLVAHVNNKHEMHNDEITNLKWIRDAKTGKKKYLVSLSLQHLTVHISMHRFLILFFIFYLSSCWARARTAKYWFGTRCRPKIN